MSSAPRIPVFPRLRDSTIPVLVAFCLTGPLAAQRAVITVDTTSSNSDFGGARQIADLPGPDGLVSFREAIDAAVNTPGLEAIHFAIPMNGSNVFSGGVAMIEDEGIGGYAVNEDDLVIDFTTQTTNIGDTNPNGNEVGFVGDYLTLTNSAILLFADRCVIRGLDKVELLGYAINVVGSDNRIVGCTLSGGTFGTINLGGWYGRIASRNVIGGVAPGEANLLDGPLILDGPAEDNVIIGNEIRGKNHTYAVRVWGTRYTGWEVRRNRIGGPNPGEGNVIVGVHGVNHEGKPEGALIGLRWAEDTVIEGNYIGVESDGFTVPAVQTCESGIEVWDSPNTVIRGNVIAGIYSVGSIHWSGVEFGTGISCRDDVAGLIVQGNRIGADATGSFGVRTHMGIQFAETSGSFTSSGTMLIGGTSPGEGNLLAFLDEQAISVDPEYSSVEISGNSMRDNGRLGIDLLVGHAFGVTPNDLGDTDGGPNNAQNYPVLRSATQTPGGTLVTGTLDSRPLTDYRIEFFANSMCDPLGHGEGETYLGSVVVNGGARGSVDFVADLPNAVPPGTTAITATATDLSTGDTSEFSACLPWAVSLDLDVPTLQRGQPAAISVSGAQPGESVTIGLSMTGIGAGPCPAQLGGLCLELLPPVTPIGTVVAGANGTATLNVNVPPTAPLVQVWFQAAAPRGAGGLDSVKSDLEVETVLP